MAGSLDSILIGCAVDREVNRWQTIRFKHPHKSADRVRSFAGGKVTVEHDESWALENHD
jgi:hypothetical protein